MELTNNYRLKKPAQTDGYNIDDHNANTDIIDRKIRDLEIGMDSIELVDSKVAISDSKGVYIATKLDGVLDEIDTRIKGTEDKINKVDMSANKVSYTDTTTQLGTTTVQGAIEKLAAELNGATARLKSANDSIEADVGNPV